jgi:hypothetical protein
MELTVNMLLTHAARINTGLIIGQNVMDDASIISRTVHAANPISGAGGFQIDLRSIGCKMLTIDGAVI